MTTLEIVTAVNDRSRYLDCAPWFIKFWLVAGPATGLHTRPKIIYVGDGMPSMLEPLSDFVQRLSVSSVPSGFAAQNIRVLAAGWSDADLVMTTDIDMLPVSQRVTRRMVAQLAGAPDGFVIGRDVLSEAEVAICYNMASPATWSRLWQGTCAPENAATELDNILQQSAERYEGTHGGLGWHIDQQHLHQRLRETGINVVRLNDSFTGHRRLDRGRHRSPRHWAVLPSAASGYFTDYHVHLPIGDHQTYVRMLYMMRKHLSRYSRVPSSTLCSGTDNRD
jgi:hypothetical protein